MFRLTLLMLLLANAQALANDFCITGVKGTATSNYIFKVSQSNALDRKLTVLDQNHHPMFSSKVENRFTQFNTTGYGVCSLTAKGTEEASGVQFSAELKVAPHSKTACRQFQIPTAVEYITLKIAPKGTTLGDDLTAYALTIVPCP